MRLRRDRPRNPRVAFSGLVTALLCLAALDLSAQTAAPLRITINDGEPIYTRSGEVSIAGSTDAAVGSVVSVRIGDRWSAPERVTAGGRFSVRWPEMLDDGLYPVLVSIIEPAGRSGSATTELSVQRRGRLPRQSVFPPPREVGPPPAVARPEDYKEMTDRWRIAPPPYELDENTRGKKIGDNPLATTDPYNKNILKGDYPIVGNDIFLNFTAISDTLIESRSVPTPSGASAKKPASFRFFGKENQNLILQNLIFSFDLFQGNTNFEPIRQRLKATIIGNISHVRVYENALVKPDVRRGTERTDGRVSLQELFYERKLKDLTPNFDFLSVRLGSQPFVSDFRGFIFSDTNLGIRLFGNYGANKYQYNFAVFDRLEKDTNSGLNTLTERRGEQVVVANLYKQDFIWPGYTTQFSFHYMHDEPSFKFDRNGILVRPAPIGVFRPHEINAYYFGWAGLGHIGRWNVDHAIYYVIGSDSLDPIAGPDPELRGRDSVEIGAGMAALEVSYDRDWLRPRLAVFYSQGDRKPRDRHARGFDSIFDSPNFAGGGFSFFNRLAIRLTGSGVALVERGSLIPSLISAKDEGQSEFVNPGIQLASVGLDVDVTPRLKAIFTGNYIRLDTTAPIEALLFQGDIRNDLGTDLSVGIRYRPFLSQNFIVVGGVAGFLPGGGFKDIYEEDNPLFHVFSNVILTF